MGYEPLPPRLNKKTIKEYKRQVAKQKIEEKLSKEENEKTQEEIDEIVTRVTKEVEQEKIVSWDHQIIRDMVFIIWVISLFIFALAIIL